MYMQCGVLQELCGTLQARTKQTAAAAATAVVLAHTKQ